jgi:hypothetical protein
MADTKTRLKDQRRTITIVLSIAAILMLATSFFIRDKETAVLVRSMGCGLLLAMIIFQFFKGTFGYKPTREEMEEKKLEKNN